MESIDKLREYVKEHTNSEWAYATAPPKYPLVNCADVDLLDIADAIEREVKDMRDFCERIDDAATKREDVTLWGVDYMPYPLDADGEPIHVGDVMEWDNGTFTVHELKVTEDGWTTWDEQHGYTVHVDVCHHHAPTVEDVLEEFAQMYIACNDKGTIAEYAAKLTLRGDE